MNTTNQNTSFLDVISGKTAVKVEIGIDIKSILILCVGLFIVILCALVITKKI